MGASLKSLKKKITSYLATHKKSQIAFEYIVAFLGTAISAFLCAFSFKCFMSPNIDPAATVIVPGGASGISRTIALIFQMSTGNNETFLIYSIAYAVLNIPSIYIAFRYISVRFGLFTLLNVVGVSLITNFVDVSFVDDIAKSIACVIETDSGTFQAGMLTRAILGAVFAGAASAIAFASGTSAGGSDTIGYFLALRKQTSVGPYLFVINGVVVVLYCILSIFDKSSAGGLSNAFLSLIFAIIYQFMISLVIDAINKRNKKEQLQIITKDMDLPKKLLNNFPHGATVVKAKGAYTGEDRIIIYTIVSFHETKHVIERVRELDSSCFVNITSVKQVYGRFFIPPIR